MFAHISSNDQPIINVIYNNDCENHTIHSDDTINFDSEYEVINQTSHPEYQDKDNPSIQPTPWKLDEENWIKTKHQKWKPIINQIQIQNETINPIEYMSSVYPHLQFEIMTAAISPLQSQQKDTKIRVEVLQQSDSGANTSATNNLDMLHDVTYINPVNVNSATKDADPMRMMAIGTLHLPTVSGEILKPVCYYSPDISGTIISPDAIARQYSTRFQGFRNM